MKKCPVDLKFKDCHGNELWVRVDIPERDYVRITNKEHFSLLTEIDWNPPKRKRARVLLNMYYMVCDKAEGCEFRELCCHSVLHNWEYESCAESLCNGKSRQCVPAQKED